MIKDIKEIENYNKDNILIYYDEQKYFVLNYFTNYFDEQVYFWVEITKHLQINNTSNSTFYFSIDGAICGVKNKVSKIWCVDSIYDIVDLINTRKEET